MSHFGSGPVAARALRDRILAGLGAESEWTEADGAVTCWTSGPATTCFLIEDGPQSAPNLGVLRIVTPVATVADRTAALWYCNELNFYTTTNRWTVSLGEYNGDETDLLRVSCSFVVGPHNTDALAAFAQWCVREQIAIATAKMTSDIAEIVGGKPCLYSDHEGGPYRAAADWHEVVYHYDRVVTPASELPGEPLGAQFNQALRVLVGEMLDEGADAWFSAGLDDPSPYTTYETPFAWDKYPDAVITTSAGGDVPTTLVQTLFGAHPHIGNGLLITMRIPVTLTADDALETVNALNLLDAEFSGATHSIGGWFAKDLEPTYVIYLPAVLANEAHGIDLPAAMRELQLTLARQALLARTVLLSEDELDDSDRNGPGLRIATTQHGLAWGETGEGRNLGAEVLTTLFDKCVGGDTDWAVPQPGSFTWWPYQQAQEIAAFPWAGGGDEGVVIRIATEVRRDVAVTPEALTRVAAANAELPQSALVLRDDGSLILACQIFLHDGTRWWASAWAQCLAADQLVNARDLGSQLADLGVAPTSGHPKSGLRPSPDELFGIREDYLIPAAARVQAGLASLVPLMAVTSQYALPYTLSVAEDGGLEFSWHPSQLHGPVVAEPIIRVELGRGESAAGIGWVVRSHVPVAGDIAARSQWCNDRNVELLVDPADEDLTVVGSWGTAPNGSCCLTTWISPHIVRDEVAEAAGLVGNILRYHQGAIQHTLTAEPSEVPGTALTAEDLASGLESAISTFAEVLGYPENTDWSADMREAGAVVTLSGRSWTGEPFMAMHYDDASYAEAEEPETGIPPHSFQMKLTVPLGYNRTELSLLYSALLSFTQSDTRPGERDGFPADWYARGLPIELESRALLQRAEDGSFTFSISQDREAQARFQVDRVKFGPNPIESPLWMYDPYCMRVAGVIADPDATILQVDGDMIGTWNQYRDGLAYEVVIPPIPAVWPVSLMLQETLSWIGRHVTEHVQAAIRG